MGKTIYVVTHPEAVHHTQGLVGGWYDSELTAKGSADARAIARWLRAEIPGGVEVDVFSSDLLRAQQTAEPVGAALDTTVRLDRRLREKSYGAADGRPQRWLDERFIPPPATGDRLSHDEGPAGAETKAAFATRVYSAMEEITARPTDRQVIITHGFTLTFVIAAWIQMPLASVGYANFRSQPGSITALRQDDFFHNRQVAVLAQTSHLQPDVGQRAMQSHPGPGRR
ncbi:histidine phosphatase family protein [Mycolicibacter minnesotensis]